MRFPILFPSFPKNKFSLDSSGIAGFFGGEDAFAAMKSVHLIPGLRWMGWYNSPGSYFVAKKYGVLPDSTFWDVLFPGPSITPAKLVELDTKPGPRYSGVYSGTHHASTGHLAYLIARYCNDPEKVEAKRSSPVIEEISDRINARGVITVTVVNFADVDENIWDIPEGHFQPIPPLGRFGIMATILFSWASSVLAALYGDWFSFSTILYGAFANGITLLVLGTGNLCLDVKSPSPDSPPGHGVMWDSNKIILMQGTERIISTILESGYRLEYSNDIKYQKIGYCSILLIVQFLLQLFLIPQGTLVGQILFLSTLFMSWICNRYLAFFDQEEMQTELLFKFMGRKPACYKFVCNRWSSAVAFTMAYFNFKDIEDFENADPEAILDELIPNSTASWNLWKSCVCGAVKENCLPSDLIRESLSNDNFTTAHLQYKDAFDRLLTDRDRVMVRTLLYKADEAFEHVATVKAGLEEEIEVADSARARAGGSAEFV